MLPEMASCFYAALELATRPLCEFRRFPMVGEFFSNIAGKIARTRGF